MESISSALGYYNILAHVIPGVLYLYILNEVSRISDLPYFDLSVLNNTAVPPAILAVEIVVLILAAFVISHILEPIAARIMHLTLGKRPRIDTLERLKQIYPTITIDFSVQDIEFLYTIIRQRSQDVSHLIEQYQALSIMLRNLAVGFFFLGVLAFTKLALGGGWSQAILGILALLLSVVAVSRSNINRIWSYNIIYEAALEYGSNLKEVIESSSYRQNKSVEIKRKQTRKKGQK